MLLADGRVLVVDGAAQVAELYDPTTGTWTLTSSLPTARRYPAATLLADGTVLIVGGASRFAHEYPYGPVNALGLVNKQPIRLSVQERCANRGSGRPTG